MKAWMQYTAGVLSGVLFSACPALAQVQRPNIGLNPDAQNQDLENAQAVRLLDEQRQAEEAQRHNGQIAKFKKAVEPRKARFADFDQIVFHGNAPLTPSMLDLMTKSPYAADMAYYLAKHPDQAGAIARLKPAKVSEALHELEAALKERDQASQ